MIKEFIARLRGNRGSSGTAANETANVTNGAEKAADCCGEGKAQQAKPGKQGGKQAPHGCC